MSSSNSPSRNRLTTFVTPKPKPWLINALTWVNRYIMLKGTPVLRNWPLLKHLPLIRGLCDVRYIDFPTADAQCFAQSTASSNACVITPNHPEFFTDWMLDKELAARFAPYMASWATHGIVNGMGAGMQQFWLANHIIAQIPNQTETALDYSVHTILKGTPVLLHPEGNVLWHSDQVQHCFAGAAKIALQAAQQNTERPLLIAPIVWKLVFIHNETRALERETTLIEKRLHLPSSKGQLLSDRIRLLYEGVLQQRSRLFGCSVATTGSYFAQQANYLNQLVAPLWPQFCPNMPIDSSSEHAETTAKSLLLAIRTQTKQGLKLDKDTHKRHLEISRILRTAAMVYATPTWQLEHIAENLKRLRCDLLTKHWRDQLHQFIPRPVGGRVAHIRVPEAYDVRAALAENPSLSAEDIMAEIRHRLQHSLDALNQSLDQKTTRPSFVNPFTLADTPYQD